jgi:hypothetical protein
MYYVLKSSLMTDVSKRPIMRASLYEYHRTCLFVYDIALVALTQCSYYIMSDNVSYNGLFERVSNSRRRSHMKSMNT